MSRTKELGEAWFGCQAELKHLKAILKLKETHILTLKEYIPVSYTHLTLPTKRIV